jgi:hypothetical protein
MEHVGALRADALRVRVYIPHFCGSDDSQRYASGRSAERFVRQLAFSRCLLALQGQRRRRRDLSLNIGERLIDALPPAIPSGSERPELRLEIQVVSNGRDRLAEVLELYADSVREHVVSLEDPQRLPLEARALLMSDPEPADLWLYLEDDLVLLDPLFFDKQWWWLDLCGHQQVLMPHRYELVRGGSGGRLLVDGPLRKGLIGPLNNPQEGVLRATYDGREVGFDRTANPHAGLFVISERQRQELRQAPLPEEGFIGPLETVATFTVLHRYPVCKPSLPHRRFLMVEHGHPSFRGYVESFPLRPLGPVDTLGRLDW